MGQGTGFIPQRHIASFELYLSQGHLTENRNGYVQTTPSQRMHSAARVIFPQTAIGNSNYFDPS